MIVYRFHEELGVYYPISQKKEIEFDQFDDHILFTFENAAGKIIKHSIPFFVFSFTYFSPALATTKSLHSASSISASEKNTQYSFQGTGISTKDYRTKKKEKYRPKQLQKKSNHPDKQIDLLQQIQAKRYKLKLQRTQQKLTINSQKTIQTTFSIRAGFIDKIKGFFNKQTPFQKKLLFLKNTFLTLIKTILFYGFYYWLFRQQIKQIQYVQNIQLNTLHLHLKLIQQQNQMFGTINTTLLTHIVEIGRDIQSWKAKRINTEELISKINLFYRWIETLEIINVHI